jgi:hypothetical protein
MDIVHTWSEKLAKEVAPDEVDLAPLIADAFVKGGKDRKELFQHTKDGVLGAFNPGEVFIIFPLLLQAIATAAPILYKVLSSGAINNFLSLMKDAISLKEGLQRQKKMELSSEGEYEQLGKAIKVLSDTLQSSGLTQDQRDLITYRVLKAFLEDPQEALPFLRKVTEKK